MINLRCQKIQKNQTFENIFSKMFELFFRRSKKYFFKTHFFETYILSEVHKNRFLWQSDHGLGRQTTIYRDRKFAKNEAFRDMLQRAPSYAENASDQGRCRKLGMVL